MKAMGPRYPLEAGERLCRLRLEVMLQHTMTRKEMCKHLGVSAAFLSMVLSGEKKPTRPMLRLVGMDRITLIQDGIWQAHGEATEGPSRGGGA